MDRHPGEGPLWLRAARAGSAEALGRALETCRGYLLQIARRELGPDLQAKCGASDLVQQTFLEANRDFSCFHGATEMEWRAWLRRLLLNNLANVVRGYRDTAKRAVGREVALATGDSAGAGAGGPAAGQPSPSSEMMAREQAEAVQRALDRLPETYRQALVLRHEHDLTFEEIGRQLGRSADAARKLWARAVESFQKECKEPP
jgi:RNA polymerase sigma-70 factor (ECF subfamily)